MASISDPPEICHALEQLEATKREIEQLSSRLTVLQKKHDKLQQTINAYRASCAPIHAFPDELLLQILEEYTEHDPYLAASSLLVCRRWHNIALHAPQLWNYIEFTFSNEWDMKRAAALSKTMYMACLARSGSRQLHIRIDIAGLNTSSDRLRDLVLAYILSLEPEMDARQAKDASTRWSSSWLLPKNSLSYISHVYQLFRWLTGSDDAQRHRWETLSLALPAGKEDRNGFWSLFCCTAPNLTSLSVTNFFDSMIRRDASPRFPRLESLAVSGRIAFLRNLSPGIDTTSITRLEIIFTEPLAYTWASDLALFSRLRHLGIIDRRKYRVQGICLPTDATFDHLESLHFSTTAPTDIIWNVPPLRVLRVGIDLNDWLIKVPDVQAEHVAVEFTWDFLNGMEKKLSEIS
ncbi:hypothetical protein M408DRAFT_30090, partial [Serendipita vermifera MAFF 305830]